MYGNVSRPNGCTVGVGINLSGPFAFSPHPYSPPRKSIVMLKRFPGPSSNSLKKIRSVTTPVHPLYGTFVVRRPGLIDTRPWRFPERRLDPRFHGSFSCPATRPEGPRCWSGLFRGSPHRTWPPVLNVPERTRYVQHVLY